jgi:hypothetical protein
LRWRCGSALDQTDRKIEKWSDAAIFDSVKDVDSLSPGSEHARVGKAHELIRNRLRFHGERFGDVGQRRLAAPDDVMENPNSRIVRKDFEQTNDFGSIVHPKQWPGFKRRPIRTRVLGMTAD